MNTKRDGLTSSLYTNECIDCCRNKFCEM